jgi:hypothetical protein
MNRLKMLYYNFVYKLVSKLPFAAIGNVLSTCFILTIKFRIILRWKTFPKMTFKAQIIKCKIKVIPPYIKLAIICVDGDFI